jgi:hypothetical protein
MAPATWKIFRAAAGPAAPTNPARQPWRYEFRTLRSRALQRLGQYVPEEALTLLRLAAGCTYLGTTACLLGLVFYPMPDVFPGRPGEIAPAEFLTAVAGGLWLANLAVLWRTTMR